MMIYFYSFGLGMDFFPTTIQIFYLILKKYHSYIGRPEKQSLDKGALPSSKV